MITLEALSVRYPGAARPSLVEAELVAPDAVVTGIAGASESGKTTLCLALAGLIPRVVRASVSGGLSIGGEATADLPMHALCERVSLLTGAPDAMLSLVADTVYEEVAFGPANLGLSRDEILRRTGSALETVRIGDLAERDPRYLSTGQTQLLAIASLLAMGTTNLVLDEPTAHLDPAATERLVGVLRSLGASGAAIVIASADTGLLAAVADRVAILHESRLGPVGPVVDVLADPRIRGMGLEPIEEVGEAATTDR